MASIFRLNRPCPCGSGKSFDECCAPRGKRKERKRRRRKDPKSARRGSPAKPMKLDADTRRKLEDFQRRFNAFYDGFIAAHNECIQLEEQHDGPNFIEWALMHLETTPESAEIAMEKRALFTSYALFGVPGRSDWKRERARAVEKRAGSTAAAALDRMADAAVGAWRIDNPSTDAFGWQATRLDGQHPPTRTTVVGALDHQLDELGPGTYAGWKLDIGDFSVLFQCVRLDDLQQHNLSRAADRQAWGSGEGFRLRDYQDDVVSLMLVPFTIDTERTTGRIFLNEIVAEHWSLDPVEMRQEVAEWIYFAGLDMTLDEAADVMWNRQNAWGSWDLPRPKVWSLTAARATGEEFERVADLLRSYRAETVSFYVYDAVPIGDQSLEYVLPLADMLSIIGLEADGSVDHPTARNALNFPLAVLDLDPGELRRAGFDPAWSIQQARTWAREQRAPEDLRAKLDAAIDAHLIACRWAGIVARTEHSEGRALAVRYDGLIAGIRHMLPTEAMHTPLRELDDPGRGTWTRIEKRLRAAGELAKGDVLTLGRLPKTLNGLLSVEGIGEGSAEHLRDALAAYAIEWPASAGHLPTTRSTAEADEAADELHSGLDELDDLF